MRDWRYYAAKSWMNMVYSFLALTGVGAIGLWIWLMVTDPTLRMVATIVLFIAIITTILNLLFKLTQWAEDILEKDKNGKQKL